MLQTANQPTEPKPRTRRYTTAYCYRTKMIGGGTSYDVYFRKADKPSYPLHGNTYATVICRSVDGTHDGKREEFFSVVDAIDPRERWAMDLGWAKYETHKRLESRAQRLEIRIARRAYPELAGLKRLPLLWADWTMESAVVKVKVRITLPE